MIVGITGKAGSGKDAAADYLVKEYGFVRVALADPMKRICADVFGWSKEDLWGPSENRNVPDVRYPRQMSPAFFCSKCGVPRRGSQEMCFCGSSSFEQAKQDYLTPRYALQQLGEEWGRRCYADVWVDYCMHTAKLLLEGGLLESEVRYDPARGLRYRPSSLQDLGSSWGVPPKGVVVPDVRYDNEAKAIQAAGGQVWLIDRPGAGLEGEAAKHKSEQGVREDLINFCIKNNKHFGWLYQQVQTLMSGKEVTT